MSRDPLLNEHRPAFDCLPSTDRLALFQE